jgi:hypothetical protein
MGRQGRLGTGAIIGPMGPVALKIMEAATQATLILAEQTLKLVEQHEQD